jgi:hypothetical protein
MGGEAVARLAGVENGDAAPGAGKLQGGGKAGKAPADDDGIFGHGSSFLWSARHRSPDGYRSFDAEYREGVPV